MLQPCVPERRSRRDRAEETTQTSADAGPALPRRFRDDPDGFLSARDLQLFHDRPDVAADGDGRDLEAIGDRPRRQAFGKQLEHVTLATRQLGVGHTRQRGPDGDAAVGRRTDAASWSSWRGVTAADGARVAAERSPPPWVARTAISPAATAAAISAAPRRSQPRSERRAPLDARSRWTVLPVSSLCPLAFTLP